jgi:hypothetical protein
MLKLRITSILFVGFALVLGGCASSIQSVQINKDKLSPKPYDALAVGYSKTYFQPRFMGKSIGTGILFGPIIGAALWQGIGNYENKSGTRISSNDYENLLGDFDTTEYFFQQFEQKINSQKYIKFTFTKDVDTANKIISNIKNDGLTIKSISDGITKDGYPCIAAFKVAYGLGARQGNEQIGFRKYYRPFIRIVGSVKNLSASEVLWQDSVIVFSDKRYLGSDADADKIESAGLILALKSITNEAIDLLIRSINGEQQKEIPILVDTNNADFEF